MVRKVTYYLSTGVSCGTFPAHLATFSAITRNSTRKTKRNVICVQFSSTSALYSGGPREPATHSPSLRRDQFSRERPRVLTMDTPSRRNVRCDYCYERNHVARNCRHGTFIKCDQCGEFGHKTKHHMY